MCMGKGGHHRGTDRQENSMKVFLDIRKNKTRISGILVLDPSFQLTLKQGRDRDCGDGRKGSWKEMN